MIGIKAIAAYVPDKSIDNLAQARRFGESESFIREKIGALCLARMPDGMETSDMAAAAIENLCVKSGLGRSSIDALVVITQNGDGHGLPHTAAIVQAKAELPMNIAAFDVSLGCSGWVYGLTIVKGLLETAGMKNAVLVTADPYSKIIDPKDRVTALLFGDAATATWIGDDAKWEIGTPLFATDGAGAEHLKVASERFVMNGRQVFNFAATRVPKQIIEYLERHNLAAEEIDLYCMHQGSASIVATLARKFPSVSDRFLCDLRETGNTVSSSIPLLLHARLDDPEIRTVLVSGFGVGLSWATTLLKRKNYAD